MNRNRAFLIFSVLVLSGMLAFVVVSLGYYPVALVGGTFITAKQFTKNYEAATVYYGNLLKGYTPGAPENKLLRPIEIQASVLDQLIENALVARGAEEEAGSDLAALVESKLGRVRIDEKLGDSARQLYGLAPDDFRNEILVPQAKTEILSGRLFLKGEKIGAWIARARSERRVIIFSPKLSWAGGRVVINDQ